MKFMKLLLLTIAATSSYCLFARQFDITIDQNSGFITKQGSPAKEGGRIDITGMFMHKDAPSYRDVSSAIVKKFDLDIRAKNLEITFMDQNTGQTGLLKTEIKGATAKNRSKFFDSIQKDGVVMLNVTKPGMAQEGAMMTGAQMEEPGYQSEYQTQYQ